MANWFKDTVSRNLRKPEDTFIGMLISKGLERRNGVLEREAVKLCEIKPDDTVLEVGYGPGVGLEAAALLVEGGEGTIYGADFSPRMVKTATKRLRDQIKNGKVNICEANVEKLPYEDNMFDKVFHVNCYYFWPDMTLALRELFRVMKPHSVIITVLDPEAIKQGNERDIMRFGNTDSSRYVDGLKNVGFQNVTIQDIDHPDKHIKAILAHVDSTK